MNFLGPETAGWGRGLPHEGVVEKFVLSLSLSLESLFSLFFESKEGTWDVPGIFAGMSRTPGGVRRVCAKPSNPKSIRDRKSPSSFST